MTLKEKILFDIKEAMKAGDSSRRDVLRMLDSAVKNTEIEKKKREDGLNDQEVLEVIAKAVKQRQDSVRQFEEGGRPELAEKEKEEIAILMPYLPEQLSEGKIVEAIEEVIKSTGANGAGDIGKVMGQAMAKLKGQADGNIVRELAKKMLEK